MLSAMPQLLQDQIRAWGSFQANAWPRASYRHLGRRTLCRACVRSYHTSERLLMHWKTATTCRAKLIAAGAWQEDAVPGVRTWRKTRESEFILCPPEPRVEPLATPPVAE